MKRHYPKEVVPHLRLSVLGGGKLENPRRFPLTKHGSPAYAVILSSTQVIRAVNSYKGPQPYPSAF